jgi:2-oxoisovalerate dehydrogenase E1 component alpha subunit
MIRTRALEERSVKLAKSGEAFFWVGGPGEEAFNTALGLHVHKGHGPAYDFLHLHYRNAGLLLALGMPMVEHFRQLAMRRTDRFGIGRQFVGHYAMPEWNIVPVTSVIQAQCVMAPGTARVQKRLRGRGITICVSGDAGTAEGDFESGLLWSNRPGEELPVLFLVTNNGYGISTPASTQHGVARLADRALPYEMPSETVDGNDPLRVWRALERAFDYVRRERKPYLLEARVSRLHGHSSSSGANRNREEVDCIELFSEELLTNRIVDAETVAVWWSEARAEADQAADQAMCEPEPQAEDVARHVFAPSSVDQVYPLDYTGLPGQPAVT